MGKKRWAISVDDSDGVARAHLERHRGPQLDATVRQLLGHLQDRMRRPGAAVHEALAVTGGALMVLALEQAPAEAREVRPTGEGGENDG